jgi:hypothetical protein
LERAQAVTDDFAFGRIVAGGDLRFDYGRHVVGQRYADRLWVCMAESPSHLGIAIQPLRSAG